MYIKNLKREKGNSFKLLINLSISAVNFGFESGVYPAQKTKLCEGQGMKKNTLTNTILIINPIIPSMNINLNTSMFLFSIKYFSITCFVEKNKSHKNRREKSNRSSDIGISKVEA